MICDAAGDYFRSPIDGAVGLDPAVKVLRSQPTFPGIDNDGYGPAVRRWRSRCPLKTFSRSIVGSRLPFESVGCKELPFVVIVRFNLWGRSDRVRFAI
jgi:hypothetical protein